MLKGHFAAAFLLLPALLLLSLAIGLPAVPGAMLAPDHRGLAVEPALALGAGLLAAYAGWRPGRRWIAVAALLTLPVVLIRLADLVAQMVAGRPFQPAFDPALVPALWDVLAASLHPLLLTLILALIPGLLLGLLFLAFAGLLRPLATSAGRRVALGVLVAAGGLQLAGVEGFQPPARGMVAAWKDQGDRWVAGLEVKAHLAAALAEDPVGAIAPAERLSVLSGRPVVLAWVESYGLSTLTDPRHKEIVAGRLLALQESLTASGFHALTGQVESPVLGGRSWLAHGTLRAGIRQDQPVLQGAVLASGRPGLVNAFQGAGWHTVAAMPGLSGPWPEGARWGFDQVLDRSAFAYGGPSFGWSPMPDQALLAGLEQQVPLKSGQPLFLEMVLTSSHAPWTPLPPWQEASVSALADGSAFAGADLAPDYLDMAGHYAQSIDYSLRALGDWLVRAVPDDALVLVLGDHPAVGWIADAAGAGHKVPLHILSRDPSLLQPLKGWGLVDGMVPVTDPDAPPIPMENLMEKLLNAYSGPRPRGV